ncbi:MAG: molybdopterin-dependent oxidoreductase [Sphingobacteriales bacterium]|nr:molybdopterin-dependent oxidoreductase [Sphingobacteriales bacterium]MBK6891364.1 molybdopterin-dependent oxidoreductase [Sphingobacteriales bacterium]MBK8677294.1 molybdopterin-dependent oxidoreductase [Sphingobacteriales bacterium]MBL0248658.1 molybdopterin-dependent oxidoreductase [Sphingobacteriales bacterium]
MAFAFVIVYSACMNTEANHSEHHGKDASKTANNMGASNLCMVPIPPEDSAKYISKQLIVKGDVENQLTLTVNSLQNMNVATIENFTVVCQSGASMKENKTCKGVLLRDILEQAKIAQINHKDRNFYIVARATDNYKATFSWAEIFNNPTGDNVYVLFEENGQPIKAQGEMILICKNDIKTGPRHVYWLSSIEVHRVD